MAEPISLRATVTHKVALIGWPLRADRRPQRWGRASGLQDYCCNALTGTPLARPRERKLWPAQVLIAQENLVKATKRCGVAVTTAFIWRRRFLFVE